MKISRTEIDNGALKAGTARLLAGEFRRKGYVTLEEILPVAFLEDLRAEYMAALNEKIARLNFGHCKSTYGHTVHNERTGADFVPAGGNHDLNRWDMHLPSTLPFLDPRVIANPLVLQTLAAIDEHHRDCVPNLIASDVAFPGSINQGVHQDRGVFEIYVNIPLVDFTEENGPLEMWPCTHLRDPNGSPSQFSTGRHFISAHHLKTLAQTIASERMIIGAGSFLLRDMRTLHRGTANVSEAPRPMLSLTYIPPHTVASRAALDTCASFALWIREYARRGEPKTSRPLLLNIGNALGRMVDGQGLTDRYLRRKISSQVWDELPLESRHALRYAVRDKDAKQNFDEWSTFGGTIGLYAKFSTRVMTETGRALTRRVLQ